MSSDTTIASTSRTQKFDHNHRFPRYFNATAIGFVLAGLTFTVASGATNLLYALGKSPELPQQLVWGSVAAAASVALALAPIAFVRAIASRSVVGAVMATFAFALFGSFSLTGALGSAFGGRATAELQQQDNGGARARLTQSYEAARAELTTLSPARPVAELEALVAKLKATPGANGCAQQPDGPISRKVCGEANAVAVELGRSKRRAELETTMQIASGELAKSEPAKIANADAVALSTFAGKIGATVKADDLNPWLALLAVLLMELGGGVCFALADVVRGQTRTRRTAEIEQPVAPRSEAVQSLCQPEPVQPSKFGPAETCPVVSNEVPAKLDVPDSFGGRLLLLLRDRGGEVYSGHRALAKALGCSAGHVGNVLRELADAGRVTVAATKMGTVVRLAA